MSRVLTFVSRLTAPGEPLVGSDIADAREAMEYWSRREANLPWYRRAARRECREMIASWRATLVGAHLERWRLPGVADALLPLLHPRGRTPPQRTWGRLARTTWGRLLLVGALAGAAFTVTAIALVVAVVLLVAGS
jgi:hypothetical protein